MTLFSGRSAILPAFCAVLFAVLPAQAEKPAAAPIVKTEFVLAAPGLVPHKTVWAGITYTIPEHWHIYWQNPGNSGLPTTMTWRLPSGISAGDIVWPTPQRIAENGLVMYGYRERVTLPVPLTPMDTGLKGEGSVRSKWLVCRDTTCVPEEATFKFSLPGASTHADKVLREAVIKAPGLVASGIPSSYRIVGDKIVLTAALTNILPSPAPGITNALFYPVEDGIITNAGLQSFALNGRKDSLQLTGQRGNIDLPPQWHGVLLITHGGQTKSYALTAVLEAGNGAATGAESAPALDLRREAAGGGGEGPLSLLAAVALAFLGGIVLNAMPCVLPILALKAFALAKKAEASRAAAARQGVAYASGIIASFLLIAGIMVALKASGSAIGWGFQLQHSGFVAILLLTMLLVSANLLGLFELPVLFGNRAAALNEDHLLGSFLIGVLAVMVATPCSAPFMATAIGASLVFPAVQALLIFAFLGLGMASPFLLISFWPAARRLLPKPGQWMLRLRQVLAVPVFATALWLGWVLVQLNSGGAPMDESHVAYSSAVLQQLRAVDKPVLVDATAAWCLSCKVNERVALNSDTMKQFLHEKNITIMVADWTSSNPDITAYLAGFGRNGVPLYVYYPPHAAPVILPQILTPSIVRHAINGGNHA